MHHVACTRRLFQRRLAEVAERPARRSRVLLLVPTLAILRGFVADLRSCRDTAACVTTFQQLSRHCGWLQNLSADAATLRLAPKSFSRCRDTAACATTFQQMSRHCGWLQNLSADAATLRLAPKPFSRCRDTAVCATTFQQMSRHCGWLQNLSADVATLRLAPQHFSRCRDTAACATTFQFLIRRRRKLRKATVALRHVCMSVRLSAWNNSTPTGWIFLELYAGYL